MLENSTVPSLASAVPTAGVIVVGAAATVVAGVSPKPSPCRTRLTRVRLARAAAATAGLFATPPLVIEPAEGLLSSDLFILCFIQLCCKISICAAELLTVAVT